MLQRLLKLLAGAKDQGVGRPGSESLEPPGYERDVDDPLPLYGTFSLRDGHKIASDLKRNGIPFAVELNDGIEEVDAAFGSGGSEASLSLFIAEDYWEIVNDIIEIRYPGA